MKKFIETLKNCWKIEDLRQRILITIAFVAIYRFGSFVVLPGIDPSMLQKLQSQTSGGLMSLLDMFSGGAFSNASIFALGIMPYISASIVMQLLAVVVPYFQKMQREGESGRKKINWYTRVLTVAILLFQAPSYLMNLKIQAYGALSSGIDWSVFMIPATIILAAGSMFVLWLGERITEKGVGNGISIVLTINIISRVPSDLALLYENFIKGKTIAKGTLAGLIIAAVILLVVVLVLILNGAERRIPVQYSKKMVGRKLMGGQSTNIPLKVNTAGVIPVIFASSIMSFPAVIAQLTGKGNGTGIGSEIIRGLSSNNWCNPKQLQYTWGLVLYIVLCVFFAYFYTSITFNPLEVADNIKKQGGFIPGIRPGKPTSDYLTNILNYIIFIGAVGLIIVCVIPFIFNGVFGANVSFGGTSIIIIVGVILETVKQIESQLLVRNYKGFLNN